MLEVNIPREMLTLVPMLPHNAFFDKALVPAEMDGAELCGELSRIFRKLTNQKYACPNQIWIYRQVRQGEPLSLQGGQLLIVALEKTNIKNSGSMSPGTVLIPQEGPVLLEGGAFLVVSMHQKILGFC